MARQARARVRRDCVEAPDDKLFTYVCHLDRHLQAPNQLGTDGVVDVRAAESDAIRAREETEARVRLYWMRRHDPYMLETAHDALRECTNRFHVNADGTPNLRKFQMPIFGFGTPIHSDLHWLKSVYRYARVPPDVDWGGPRNRVDMPVVPMPDVEAFWQSVDVYAPAHGVGKKALARHIISTSPGPGHGAPMLIEALGCLADCIRRESPVSPNQVVCPYWAFGQEINGATQWLDLVYRYACIPEDVQWERPREGVAVARAGGGSSADSTVRRGESVTMPSAEYDALREKVRLSELRLVDTKNGWDAYAADTKKGMDALAAAFERREKPGEVSCENRAKVPVWAFGAFVKSDTQWFQKVYEEGGEPRDVEWEWTEALRREYDGARSEGNSSPGKRPRAG